MGKRKKDGDVRKKAAVPTEEVPEEVSEQVETAPAEASAPAETSASTDSAVPAYGLMRTYVSSLRDTLKALQFVVPKKTTLETLKNVLLSDGKAIANNLEVMVAIEYPDVAGQFMVPHKSVLELLKHVQGNEVLMIEQSKTTLKLSWDTGKSSYDTNVPADFPEWVSVKGEPLSIDGDGLISMLMSVVDYCATEDNRPTLTCVNLASIEGQIEMAAADGFRLAHQVMPGNLPEGFNINIPAKTILILNELWKKVPCSVPLENDLVRQVMSKRMVKLVHGEGKLSFQFGSVALVTHLLEGDFPKYKNLIPDSPPVNVRFFAPDLERAILSVRLISKDSSDRVNLAWTEESLTVSAYSEKVGDAEITIQVQADSPGKVSIKEDFLLEYLNGKEGLVSMGTSKPSAPVLLQYSKSPTVVLMPMTGAGAK